jgi:hypothetical protein
MKNLLLLLFLFVCSFGYGQFGLFNNIVDGEIESVDQIVAMDFDVDGDIDYVIRGGNYGGWYENIGSGAFIYHHLYTTIGGYSAWIDVVDFDTDGDYDIAHVGGLDDTGFLENLGDETFDWRALPV